MEVAKLPSWEMPGFCRGCAQAAHKPSCRRLVVRDQLDGDDNISLRAVGEGVSEFKAGDTVLTLSPHASHALVHRDQVRARVSGGLDLKLAVFANLALVSMTAVRVSSAELGDCVAVIGLGLIGNLAAQLFQAQGSRVIGVDKLGVRLEIARQCGLESLVDASAEDSVSAVRMLTEGRGAEVVVEATGAPLAAFEGMEMAAPNGELVLLGTPRGSCEVDIVPLLRAVHKATPNLTIKGAHVY
jgi:threonine dehydrogenase-like Zn-dependent dehydrogenase